jgi:alginate O-acetyltransferase complex protein AlgI
MAWRELEFRDFGRLPRRFAFSGGLVGLGDRYRKPSVLSRIPTMLITFALVSIGWVFFRAPTLPDSLTVLRVLFAPKLGDWPVPAPMMCLAAASLVIAVLEERFGLGERISRAPVWIVAAAIGALLFLVELFGQDKAIPFIYFQF